MDEDTPAQIASRVQALVGAVFARNAVDPEQVISLLVTATDDLHSAHPATAARRWGLHDVAIMGARELAIEGGLARCVRLLFHVETGLAKTEIEHVFLEGAVVLRPDLVARDVTR